MNDKYLDILSLMEKENKESIKLELNSRVLIIDGLNNYIRTWVVNPATNTEGEHVGGIVGFLKTLGYTIRTFKPTRVIIVFDGENGSQRRKKLYPEYKQTRGKGLRLNRTSNWADQQDEQKNMILQLKRTISYLKKLPITIITINNIEADDVIGYITKELCNNEVIISSSDKDFYQLVNDKIKVWNPKRKILINKDKVKEIFEGVSVENILLCRSIDGDKSDNIKGITGFGLKTIVKYFPMLLEDKQYTVDELLTYAKENIDKSTKYKTLTENKKKLELNYKLCRLAEDNISGSAKLKIIEQFNTVPTSIDKFLIKKMYIRDKLFTAIRDIDNWINENFSYINTFAKPKI